MKLGWTLFLLSLSMQFLFGALDETKNAASSNLGRLQKKISQLSWNEKICMRRFVDFAIKFDQMGHVLWFDFKPVCLTCLVIKDKHKSYNDTLCLKGWKAFKKHEASFPHPNFIFNEIVYDEGDYKTLNIYIINKSALKKCLSEYEQIFKSYLEESFTPETFIQQLESGQNLVSLINNDEMLLGILLGFGEESSKAYKMQNMLSGSSVPKWSEHYCPVVAEQPKGCKIHSVVFMGNPHSTEIKQLISIYEKELQLIWNDYQEKKDVLALFLDCLCKEERL